MIPHLIEAEKKARESCDRVVHHWAPFEQSIKGLTWNELLVTKAFGIYQADNQSEDNLLVIPGKPRSDNRMIWIKNKLIIGETDDSWTTYRFTFKKKLEKIFIN